MQEKSGKLDVMNYLFSNKMINDWHQLHTECGHVNGVGV